MKHFFTGAVLVFLCSLCLIQRLEGQSCSGSFSLTVNILPLPEANFTYVVDGNTVTFTNTSQHATSYVWDFGDNSPASFDENPVHTYATPGDYIVSLLALNDCGNNLGTQNVFLLCPPADIPVDVSGPVSFCEGGEVILSTPVEGTSYQWYNGADPVSNADQSSLTVTASGFYSVAVVNEDGCIHESPSVLVSVYFNPVYTFNPPVVSFCEGESLLLEGPSGFTAYQWYQDAAPIDGANESYLVVSEPGNYAIEVWNILNCSVLSNSVLISQSPNPEVTISPANLVVMYAGQDVYLEASSPNTIGYQWNTGSSNMSVSVNYPGLYVVTVTNSTGCTGSAATEVTLDPNSLPYIFEADVNVLSVGNNSNAVTYQWYLNGVIIPGANAAFYDVLESGTYTCSVTYSNGFSATTPPFDYVIVNIADISEQELYITVIPNPAHEQFYVEMTSAVEDPDARINLYDAAGRQVLSKKVSIPSGRSQFEFDAVSLSGGFYRLQAIVRQTSINLSIIIQ